MALNDMLKSALDKTDIDEKIAAKTGFDLNSIDEKKINEVKKLAADNIDKVDIVGIAKKVGIPEDAVKKIIQQIKK